MDIAILWVSLVSALATVAGAVFTYVQAKVATDGRRDAESARDESRKARDEAAALAREANDALHRQALAQEKSLPPEWSAAIPGEGQRVSFQNTSSRHIVVEGVEVEPIGAHRLVRLGAELPTRVEYGDHLEVYVLHMLAGSPERVKLVWRFEDEETTRVTERRV